MTKHAFSGKTQCLGAVRTAVKMKVKSTYRSCRRPQGQFPAQTSLQLAVTTVPGDPTHSSDLWGIGRSHGALKRADAHPHKTEMNVSTFLKIQYVRRRTEF